MTEKLSTTSNENYSRAIAHRTTLTFAIILERSHIAPLSHLRYDGEIEKQYGTPAQGGNWK
jgi:hypothetical protein